MNIKKTNSLGIDFINNKCASAYEHLKRVKKDNNDDQLTDPFIFNSNLLIKNRKSKIIRVSRGVMDACRLIDVGSIKTNIDITNIEFTSMVILLDNDKSGLIRFERRGSDFTFLFLHNLGLYKKMEFTYNTFSFITKDFYFENDINVEYGQVSSREKSVFAIQLLAYLIYGEITERCIPSKSKINAGNTRIVNNSNLDITFCDSLWKQRINTEGFKVRGHFRLQPVGEERKNRKLIWIEEFEKTGYNRKATVEMMNS